MRRTGIARIHAGEARLQNVVSRGVGLIEQDHGLGLALDDGVLRKLGVYQRATSQIDVEHEDIGDDADLAGGGCRFDGG